MSWIIICSIIVFLSFLLCWIATRNIFSITIVNFAIWILAYLGGISFAYREQHYNTLFVITAFLLCYSLGVFIMGLVKDFYPATERKDFLKRGYMKLEKRYRTILKVVVYIGIVISLLFTFQYFKSGMDILLTGNLGSRIEAIQGNGMFYRALITYLPLCIVFLLNFSEGEKKSPTRRMAIGLIVLIILGRFASLSRGGAIVFFFLIVFYFGNLKPSKVYKLLTVLIGMFIFVAIMNQILYVGKDVDASIIERATVVQAEGIDYIVNELPRQDGRLLYWSYLGFLRTIRLSDEPFILPGVYIFAEMHDTPIELGYTSTTLIIGELYADFGLFGTLLGGLLFGMAIQYIYIDFIRSAKDDILFPVKIYLQYVTIACPLAGDVISIFANQGMSLIVFSCFVTIFYVVVTLPSGKIKIYCKNTSVDKFMSKEISR